MKGVIQNRFTSEERASGYLFTSEDQILFQAMWRLLTGAGPWSGEVIWKIRWEITVWGGYMEIRWKMNDNLLGCYLIIDKHA